MKFTDLFEHDGETLATTLERGKSKLNDWYEGFYAGFHGQAEQDDRSEQFNAGFRKGKTASSQKMNG